MRKRLIVYIFLVISSWLLVTGYALTEEPQLEYAIDIASNTTPLSKVFMPNIDLSGRGFQRDNSWPQNLAAPEVLEAWRRDIGFNRIYRLQYNLWEISQLAKDKPAQDKLLANYETVIKNISDAGGVVIIDLFGTPQGMGTILDKKSPPRFPSAFKGFIKARIRELSCDKRYNVWYEVWSAPDLDDFFLGRKQEYFALYKAVAEAIKELKEETRVFIPLGGPGSSWWFQNLDGNTIIRPQSSLIYELIKFCSHYNLPLDFISWHAYSTDPKAEKEITLYNKTPVVLIRDWLSYFNFDRNTPLIIDEWNYDSGGNVLPGRQEQSFIAASFIPARLKNMYEAGLDYQLFFSLEDFRDPQEGVIRNLGIFSFDPEASSYKGEAKSIYNVFRMLGKLGKSFFPPNPKLNDDFIGVISAKKEDEISLIIYNYINPQAGRNYLSRNISGFNDAERRILLNIAKSGELEKIIRRETDLSGLRLSNKLKAALKKAQELDALAAKFISSSRNIKLEVKNLKDDYLYQRYTVDSSCSSNCQFAPVEEKEIKPGPYQEILVLSPYSVNMIIFKKNPKAAEATN